jgi:hypothetical protein
MNYQSCRTTIVPELVSTTNEKQLKQAIPHIISLRRFLKAILMARPAECLALPSIVTKPVHFTLDEKEEANVLEHTTKYARAFSSMSSR